MVILTFSMQLAAFDPRRPAPARPLPGPCRQQPRRRHVPLPADDGDPSYKLPSHKLLQCTSYTLQVTNYKLPADDGDPKQPGCKWSRVTCGYSSQAARCSFMHVHLKEQANQTSTAVSGLQAVLL